MRRAPVARSFCVVVVMRLSPDSACDKNAIANMIASKQVSRTTAFNRFMVLLLLLRVSIVDFPYLEAEPVAGALRFRHRWKYCAGASKKGKQNLWAKPHERY